MVVQPHDEGKGAPVEEEGPHPHPHPPGEMLLPEGRTLGDPPLATAESQHAFPACFALSAGVTVVLRSESSPEPAARRGRGSEDVAGVPG